MNYERELEIALESAQKAGDLALQHFARETPADEKPDASPVTAADRECERLISLLLQERLPGDGICGEEGARIASRTGRRWIIDPIDGTKDFVRRGSFWSVQLALEVGSRVVLGVIHCPCMKETLYAVAGSGCFWNGEKVSGPPTTRLDKSILMVSGFANAWKTWPPEAVRFLTERCWTVRCYGGCYDVIAFARGKADLWLSGSGMEWDYAPARIIAGECGARFLTKNGDDRIDAGHCVLCPPGIEREIRKILKISD